MAAIHAAWRLSVATRCTCHARDALSRGCRGLEVPHLQQDSETRVGDGRADAKQSALLPCCFDRTISIALQGSAQENEARSARLPRALAILSQQRSFRNQGKQPCLCQAVPPAALGADGWEGD